MGKLFPILGILVIAIGFWYISTEDNNLQQRLNEDVSEAKSLVYDFGKTGEQIEFFLDPQPPVTEFTYVEKEVTKEVFNPETNQTETVTETEIQKVPTSEVTVDSYDRQTANTKVCKRGNQCDIKGSITLIDPATNTEIAPPYGLFVQVTCNTSYETIMTCNNFSPRTQNILTYADKSFKYTFTTDQNDPTGLYTVLVSVSSKFTTVDPTTGLESKVRRDGTLNLEIVP